MHSETDPVSVSHRKKLTNDVRPSLLEAVSRVALSDQECYPHSSNTREPSWNLDTRDELDAAWAAKQPLQHTPHAKK
jgi:hypothetical protein